jgi:hypothetical protein
MKRSKDMNSVLEEIQQHAAALPSELQVELLNYLIYLEHKAHGNANLFAKEQQREETLEWQNLMLAQAVSLTDWDNTEDEVWNDVPAI